MDYSDYFDEFFASLGSNKCKRIYFVTFNQNSYDRLKESSSEWGVNWNNLNNKKVKIIPIFTSDGTSQPKFQSMLSLLNGCDR